jgi:hypothetical protein
MSDQLLYYSNISLSQVPGIDNFLKFTRYFLPNVGPMDRTHTLTMPFRCADTDPIPAFDPTFSMSYKDCVMQRVQELDQIYQTTGQKFRLLYSGGIDSTGILAAFVEYYGLDTTSDILEISCSKESISENPWTWDRYIRKGNFKLVNSHDHTNGWNDNRIIIMGEINDHLFGGLGAGRWTQYCMETRTNLYAPTNIATLVQYLIWSKRDNDASSAYYCAAHLMKVVNNAPFPISNMYLLMWWYNFVLGWNGCLYRVLSQSTRELPKNILSTGFYQFYNTSALQQWSLNFHYDNPTQFAESETYKQECKDMILSILDIPEYRTKNKFTSFPRVHSLRPTSCLIDTDLNKYDNVEDFLKFVEPANSFVK